MDKFKASEMLGSMQFAIDGVDLENNRIPVILSDESEVVRYSWSDGKYYLSLKHGAENVDLSRADILMLFINHNTYELPIAKFEDVRLEDNKLKAWAVFDSEDHESMKIFKKLSKGFLKSFSVGINVIDKVLTKEEDGVKYYDVTSWAIDEASVVGIPAIPTAKVGLKKEEQPMGVNPASAQIENNPKGDSMSKETYTKAEYEALKNDNAEALKTATSDERARVSGILGLGGNVEFSKKAIDDGMSVGDAAIALLKHKESEIEKQKSDFEKAAEEVAELKTEDAETEELSEEAKAEKEASEALNKVYGDK